MSSEGDKNFHRSGCMSKADYKSGIRVQLGAFRVAGHAKGGGEKVFGLTQGAVIYR